MSLQNPTIREPSIPLTREHPHAWGWSLFLGGLMLVAGCMGLVATFAYTVAGVLLFGGMLLGAGVLLLLHEFTARHAAWGTRALWICAASVYTIAGGLILWNPLPATFTLTFVLACAFAALGVLRLVEAWHRRARQWRWLSPLVAGCVELLLAAVIFTQWPFSGLWLIGALIAVELLIYGWMLILAAVAGRRTALPEEAATPAPLL